MNLILFETEEIGRVLPLADRRAAHITSVLRRKIGGAFAVGIVNGPRGTATVTQIGPSGVGLAFSWEPETAPAEPITLVVGLPRPQTARDILRDATTLGIGALHFVQTEKADPNYAQSSLWSSGEWRRHAIAGAEQSFSTRIPDVRWGQPLAETLAALPQASARVALDNYEAPEALSKLALSHASCATLAIGSERGWSAADRRLLQESGFRFAHLGPRVLRTETACTIALALVRHSLGLL